MLPYVTSEQPRWAPMLRFLDIAGNGPFVNLPGNSAEGWDEPYICIVPVRNFYLLGEARALDIGQSWVLAGVPDVVVADLRRARCLLVLDLSNEGAYDIPDVFDSIYRWASDRGIATSLIVLVTQNRSLEEAHVQRQGSGGMGILCYDYFVMAMAELFALDEQAFVAKTGFRQGDALAALPRPRARTFLCLNATARAHRVVFAALLKDKQLLPDVVLSFHGNKQTAKVGVEDPGEVVALLERLDAMALLPSARFFLDTEPIYADEVDKSGNALHDAIDLRPYTQTAVSLVTETEFSDGDMTRLTEKTVKAFCLGHPTIVVGNARSLRLMRQFGFETFGPFIDESYDITLDGRERFWTIAAELDRISMSRSHDGTPIHLDPELQAICRHNVEHAQHGFVRAYQAAVERPFVDALSRRLAALTDIAATS